MHYLKRGIVLLSSYYFVYLCGILNGDYLLILYASLIRIVVII